ncbi:MAG: helix-turn-helix transcriptional regulator [Labilithrix sp.]
MKRSPQIVVPDDVEIEVADVAGERLAILTWPVVPPPSLSASEEEILRGIALGKTNAEIAKKRGTSPRTVANQVAALLEKFGVGSRHELVLAMSRRPARS